MGHVNTNCLMNMLAVGKHSNTKHLLYFNEMKDVNDGQ
jgi:hypothetical protein